MKEQYLTMLEFAERRKVSVQTISNYIHAKKIVHLKFGDNYLIPAKELKLWKSVKRGKYRGLVRV